MKHIDITFDFETVATTANAAPMQLAAVAWDRTAITHPRLILDEFHQGIDLRSCVVNGYDFDQQTVDWWTRQKDEPKIALLAEQQDRIGNVIYNFFNWIEDIKATHEATTVCLWCQGADFDIPILKNICEKENIEMPIGRDYFCDARSFVLQNAISALRKSTLDIDWMQNPRKIYDWLPPVPQSFGNASDTHNALFDCRRTTWNVWNVIQRLNAL